MRSCGPSEELTTIDKWEESGEHDRCVLMWSGCTFGLGLKLKYRWRLFVHGFFIHGSGAVWVPGPDLSQTWLHLSSLKEIGASLGIGMPYMGKGHFQERMKYFSLSLAVNRHEANKGQTSQGDFRGRNRPKTDYP